MVQVAEVISRNCKTKNFLLENPQHHITLWWIAGHMSNFLISIPNLFNGFLPPPFLRVPTFWGVWTDVARKSPASINELDKWVDVSFAAVASDRTTFTSVYEPHWGLLKQTKQVHSSYMAENLLMTPCQKVGLGLRAETLEYSSLCKLCSDHWSLVLSSSPSILIVELLVLLACEPTVWSWLPTAQLRRACVCEGGGGGGGGIGVAWTESRWALQ